MDIEQELVEQERRFWHAAGDGDFYREHFADDGRCVFSIGILDKAATVQGIEGTDPWAEVELRDASVVRLGPEAAVLTYAATARRADDAAPYRANVSSAYVRRGGRWQLAVHQQTPADA